MTDTPSREEWQSVCLGCPDARGAHLHFVRDGRELVSAVPRMAEVEQLRADLAREKGRAAEEELIEQTYRLGDEAAKLRVEAMALRADLAREKFDRESAAQLARRFAADLAREKAASADFQKLYAELLAMSNEERAERDALAERVKAADDKATIADTTAMFYKSRADKLEKALREIAQCGTLQFRDIAAAALESACIHQSCSGNCEPCKKP